MMLNESLLNKGPKFAGVKLERQLSKVSTVNMVLPSFEKAIHTVAAVLGAWWS